MAPRKFIHSPPKSWDDDIATLNKTKLFLLSTIGPTVFVLKGDDMTNQTFKVYIGENQRCSCGGGEGRGKLCVHLLYVMIKVLKIDAKNPLTWQLSLSDIEIDKILTNEHRCRRVIGSSGLSDSASTKKYHPFLKKGQGRKTLLSRNTSTDDHNNDDDNAENTNNCNEESIAIEKAARSLDNDPICSICQEEMLQSELIENKLCHCAAGCGSNFHTKCFKMYATYTKSENKKSIIVCPMCRTNWKESSTHATINSTQDSTVTVEGIKESKNTAALLPKVKCRECKIIIQTSFFRCVRCETPYDLCRRCFHTAGSRSTTTKIAAAKPSPHKCNDLALPLLFVKGEVSQYPIKWTAAILPMQNRKNRILKSQRLSELQQRDLNDYDYNYLLSLDGDNTTTPPKLHNHLLKALESINANEYLKSTEGSQDHTCALCLHSVSIEANLKRLTCPKRHVVHESCALNMFIEAESNVVSCNASACYYCTVCGKDAILFPALRREPRRRRKKPSLSFAKDCSDKENQYENDNFDNKRKDSSAMSCRGNSDNLDNVFNELIIGRTVFKPGTRRGRTSNCE